MGRTADKPKEKPLQGPGRALVEALSLSQDLAIMDRVWSLIDDIEGPGHVAATRKRLLASNPSTATLQMLAARNQLYPLQDFAARLTMPGFMALAGLVGPEVLLDEATHKPCVLVQWLTRPGASMNAKQAAQLIDELATPATIEALSAAVWRSLFMSQKLGHSRASIEPAVLRLFTHDPKFRPAPAHCLAWLKSAAYGHGRHRGPLIDLMLTQVLHQPAIEQAQALARVSLSEFRDTIAERDDDMACTSFKEINGMSLNPRRLSQWLEVTSTQSDPRILGMFLGTHGHAVASPGGVARMAENMLSRAMLPPVELCGESARQALQELVAIIMPLRVATLEFSNARAAADARLELRNEQAWNHIMGWAKTLDMGPARSMFEQTHAMATTAMGSDGGYEVRRQAVLMQLQTPAPAHATARAPRF